MLRIEPEAVFNFAKLYLDGKLRMTGSEPSLIDVLQQRAVFKPKPKTGKISPSMFTKIISALTSFRRHQASLLAEDPPSSLREYKPLNELEAMVGCREPENRRRYLSFVRRLS